MSKNYTVLPNVSSIRTWRKEIGKGQLFQLSLTRTYASGGDQLCNGNPRYNTVYAVIWRHVAISL